MIGIQYSANYNNLDGLSIIDADQIYIDGKLVDLSNLVPYTGANKTINLGAQNIQTTHSATAGADLVNLTLLQSAIGSQDTINALNFLSKLSTTAQTVAGPITFNNNIGFVGGVECGQMVRMPELALADNGVSVWSITPGTVETSDMTFSDNQTSESIVFRGTGKIEAKGFVDVDATASRAVVFNANKEIVASATTATELGYLSGVSSAIQTQLGNKVDKLGDTMSGDLDMGTNYVIMTTMPTMDTQGANKKYVDTVAGSSVSLTANNTFTGLNTFSNAKTIFTTGSTNAIYREGTGDWLRLNGGAPTGTTTCGRTAIYGGLAINDATNGEGGLCVGEWTAGVGVGNIKATGNLQCSNYYLQRGNHTYQQSSDAGKWFQIVECSGSFACKVRISWSVSGNHGSAWVSFGVQYGQMPYIRVENAGVYSKAIPITYRLAVDNADPTYGLHYLEMELTSSGNWYTADVPIYVDLIDRSVQGSITVLNDRFVAKAVGYTLYPVYGYNPFHHNLAGTQFAFSVDGNTYCVVSPITAGTGQYLQSGLHIKPVSATGYANKYMGITFGGTDSGQENTTQAGIMVQGSGSYGTRMYFETSDDWTAGCKNRMWINSNGAVNIQKNSGYAVVNGYMTGGTLTLGSHEYNFGGGSGWSANTAGLMMECLNNTEIAIHDAGDRICSFMYYSGNIFNIGRDMGWGTTRTTFSSSVSVSDGADGGTAAKLNIRNPNGVWTHFGYNGDYNYIRGNTTYVNDGGDSRLCISTYAGTFGKMVMGDRGATAWNTSAWAYNDGFHIFNNVWYPNPTANTHTLCLSSVQGSYSYISSLAPNVAWKDLVLAGAVVYACAYGSTAATLYTWGWQNASDERCKRDINQLKTSRSLERVLKARPTYYKRAYAENSTTPIPDDVRESVGIGLIAQEVLEINPHCVGTWMDTSNKPADAPEDWKGEERLSIDYQNWTIHLIGSVQEQQKMIDEQKTQITELKDTIQTMMERETIIIDHAKQQETKFNEYKALTEERLNKLASLVKQLMG